MISLKDKLKYFIEDKMLKINILMYNTITKKIVQKQLKQKIKANQPANNYINFNAKNNRNIEVLEVDQNLKNAILTCYFTKKPDPQYGVVRAEADIKYIAPWYESIVQLKLKGIVIHDGINKEFISKYENEYVQFRKFEAGNYSIFEERWFAYYLFIANTKIEKAFCTDANDVYITANPFPFITHQEAIYIGRDNANKVKDSGWLLKELAEFEKDSGLKTPQVFKYQKLYNAGVTGGAREVLLFFLAQVINLSLKTNTATHKDMTLLNLALHYNFGPNINYNLYEPKLVNTENDQDAISKNIISGYPLNSEFKKNDLSSKAYFIHK